MEREDDEAAALSEVMREFAAKSRAVFDRLVRVEGSTVIRSRLLAFVARTPEPRAVDIGATLGYAPRTVLETLDAMEAEGIVRRVVSRQDKRAKIIELTAAGQAAADASSQTQRGFAGDLFDALAPGERTALGQLIAKLNERLDALALREET